MLDAKIPPGHTVPLHTHCWPSTLYVLSWGDFVRRDGEGKIVAESRASGSVTQGSVFWLEALPPHTLENVGTTEIRAISVEIKNS